MGALDVYALAELERLANRSSWVLSYILTRLAAYKVGSESSAPISARPEEKPRVGITGVDTEEIGQRLQRTRTLRPNRSTRALDVDSVASLLNDGSPLADAIPGFEARPQQIAMARAVAEAINQGSRLIVEAGTGVGKSIAYLLPALLYASMNNRRVVVSTNTINLQEQLINKDVPALIEALNRVDGVSIADTRFAQLKGRANYLCLRRWNHLRGGESLSDHEARMLAKILVWLQTTDSGDRSELNLGYRAAAAP